MNTMDKRKAKLIARIKDKEHRDSFVSSYIQIGIPFQIKALRDKRGWTQKELADRAGTTQAWIAQIENPNYSGFSLKTLLKLASVFDVGLIARFVPISNLVKWELELSPESLAPVSFEEDPYFKSQAINIHGQSGLSLGSSMSLESPVFQRESPEITRMGKVVYLNVGQKTTEDKMNIYQKELDMPLQALAGVQP